MICATLAQVSSVALNALGGDGDCMDCGAWAGSQCALTISSTISFAHDRRFNTSDSARWLSCTVGFFPAFHNLYEFSQTTHSGSTDTFTISVHSNSTSSESLRFCARQGSCVGGQRVHVTNQS